MYGFTDKQSAQERAERLQAQHPHERFELAPHRYAEMMPASEASAVTWGVRRWVKTDSPKLPEKLDGFVWFQR